MYDSVGFGTGAEAAIDRRIFRRVDLLTDTHQEASAQLYWHPWRADEASPEQIFSLCVVMYGAIGFLWLAKRRVPKDSAYADTAHVVLLCATWAAMSVGMHVLNKSLAVELQAPALISAAQMCLAVVAVGAASLKEFCQATGRQMGLWMVVPCLFAAMLVSSFYTYEYISLSLLTVIRNLTPLVVLPIERAIMPAGKRPQFDAATVGSIVLMLAGALVYADGIRHISVLGVALTLMNMVLAVSDRLIQRRLLTAECKDLPSGVCTVLNNFFGSIPTMAFAIVTHQTRDMALPEHSASWQDPRVLAVLILSGILGIGICYLGFECQRAISATSFFVLQNVSKVAVVCAGIAFFSDPIRSPLAILGLAMSLGGSFAYGRAQMSLAEQQMGESRRLLGKTGSGRKRQCTA